MAKRSNPEEMFQAARELEQIIAEELWATRPQDRNWDTITFKQNVTGGVNDHIASSKPGMTLNAGSFRMKSTRRPSIFAKSCTKRVRAPSYR